MPMNRFYSCLALEDWSIEPELEYVAEAEHIHVCP